MTRSFDITVYGATGFTGRQLIHYLAEHAPPECKLAVAGRNRDKLAAAIAPLTGRSIGIVVADAGDRSKVHALCADTRVVANTAGPFALYGSAVLEGCAIAGTHYVDITGETPWVRDMIDAFHDRAKDSNAKIVPLCGYDSCPSDLGTWLIVKALRERGEETAHVTALQSLSGGGINGGTAASVLTLAETGRMADLRDRFLLSPGLKPSKQVLVASRDPEAVTWHAESKRYLSPFFMGPVNSRVVRRSDFLGAAQGKSYGPDFSYQEYFATATRLAAYASLAVNGLAVAGAQSKTLVKLAARLVPKPGQGPSAEAMDRGFFKTVLFGNGSKGSRLRAEVSGKGDAGNRITITFIGEAALAVAADEGAYKSGGILTPAVAFGDALLARVRARGMVASVGDAG